MQYITTISQKGQIVIPKAIRNKFKIKPAHMLKVSMNSKTIIVEPLSSADKFMGMFKVKKPITKKDIKDVYSKFTTQKFV